MRTLANDPKGTAIFLEREARRMNPLQLYRELFQNGCEAGARTVVVDGYREPSSGRLLSRVTDDGLGMTQEQLVQHLSTLHGQFKQDANFGIGARIAALPANPAGVSFSSRTTDGEGQVTLHKSRGEYGIKEWEVVTANGGVEVVEVIAPDSGELSVLDGETGTAVILHGDGRRSTWDSSTASEVRRFLSERYFLFPSDVRLFVKAPRGRRQIVLPFGLRADGFAQAKGAISFEEVAGLSGTIRWWLMPAQKTRRAKTRAANGQGAPSPGLGVLVDQEIFAYGGHYLSDFGVVYKSVKERVVILIDVVGAEMDSARAGVFFPRRSVDDRQNVPWKQLGAHFAAHMPEEINRLLAKVDAPVAGLSRRAAKELDEEWMKGLDPVPHRVPAQSGEPGVGSEPGVQSPPKVDRPEPQGKRGPRERGNDRPRRPATAERSSKGDLPSQVRDRVVPPRVAFVPEEEFSADEHPLLIAWLPTENTVQISEAFPPFVREVGRWVEKVTYPRSIVETAVRQTYQTEYAALIIDANAQRKHRMPPEAVERFKEPNALYSKALGMQSLTSRVEAAIKEMVSAL